VTALAAVRVEQPDCPECGCREWDVTIEPDEVRDLPDSVEVILRATGASCVCCGFAVALETDDSGDAMRWTPPCG
jgi:hypothetical protein